MSLSQKIKISFSIIVFSFLVSSSVQAATLELALEKNITSAKEDIEVIVILNSENQEVNTAQATISFPSNLLAVTKIDRTDSIFSFWLQEPAFDNDKGTISFVGGATSGFKGPSLKIMKIAFRVKGSGAGRLGVTDGAITASDGTGTNVYNTSKGLDINIPTTAEFQAVKIEQATRAATLAKQLPTVSGVDVPFYPDPTKWNNRSAGFQAKWNISPDTSEAGVSLNKDPKSNPGSSAEGLAGAKVFPALADGIWYLHLRLANNIGWGPTLHYRLAIDTAPPSPFKIESESGLKTNNSTPTINFLSSDLGSGISAYTVRLDGVIATTTKDTTYRFFPLLPGNHQISVVAMDQAGNSTTETLALEILPIASPKITYINRQIVVDEGQITAGGTAEAGVEAIIQVKNIDKQTLVEQVVPIDSNGNWNVTINKVLSVGNYYLVITSRDKNMASSLPVVSEIVQVKARPMLVLGGLEISQTWFFIILIILLVGSFSAGWFAYHNWRGQLGRRVTIAERDVVNIFNNLDKDIDKLLKDLVTVSSDDNKIAEMEFLLKKMKESLRKSRRYVLDNIKEISD